MKASLLALLAILLWKHNRVIVPALSIPTEEITVDRNDFFYTISECENSSSPLTCWTAPSTYRFSSETETENPHPTTTRSGLKLSAASNEFEAFQVALKSGSGALTSVTAELTDFAPSLGSHQRTSR